MLEKLENATKQRKTVLLQRPWQYNFVYVCVVIIVFGIVLLCFGMKQSLISMENERVGCSGFF